MASTDLPLPGTPFTPVFGTNHIPSMEEANVIRSILRDPEEEIRRIDQEMSRLQGRRDELQQFIDHHRSLLSPFRRFPGDLWAEVFVKCLPEDHLPVRSVREAPLLFTAICRSWREIALKTPRLWSSIHIFLPQPRTDECTGESFAALMKAREEGVKLWLRRSGALPLKISVEAYNWHIHRTLDPAAQALHVSFISFITQYSRRWNSLSLLHISPSTMQPFDILTSTDLPLLESLHEEGIITPHILAGTQHPIPTFFGAAESSLALRQLHITVRGGNDTPPPSQWALLTVLQIKVHRPDDDCISLMKRILHSCPLLQEFVLTHPRVETVEDVPLSFSSEWPHLRKLGLTLSGPPSSRFPAFLSKIFESLSAPALEDLSLIVCPHGFHLEEDGGYPTDEDLPFHNFLMRSQCELTSLHLHMPRLGDSLGKTLDVIPSLQTFTVHTGTPSNYTLRPESESRSHFDVIVQSLMQPHRCPALKTLHMLYCRPGEASVLADLIEARQHTKLESVRAKFPELSSSKVRVLASALERIRSKGSGVKVELEYRKEFLDHFDDPFPYIRERYFPNEVLVG